MQIPSFRAQLQHFEKFRELQGVPKEAVDEPEQIKRWVKWRFDDFRAIDNDSRDYDPLPNRILRWAGGFATSANFENTIGQKHLYRVDVENRCRYLDSIHMEGETLDFLDTFTGEGGQLRMECWHIDDANPDANFYQCLL